MKRRLSIKELLYTSWNHFVEYFIHWLMLFATQSLILFGFFVCCAASLALAHYFFVDLCLFNCLLSQYSKIFTISAISIVVIFSLFFFIIFPIMYKQNALDVVFNRQMSGFDVTNRFFSYAVAMFMYWMIVSCATCLGFFPGLFLAERWRFAGLHLLEHGGLLRHAFSSSWHMTRGYFWFLVGISMIQWVLFFFATPTIILVFVVIALNQMIDVNMYKKLHLEHDNDIVGCSC